MDTLKNSQPLWGNIPILPLLFLLLWGFPLSAAQGAPAGSGPVEADISERNPFAYPPRILKEMAQKPSGGGKTPAGAKESPKEYALSGILWTEKGGVASINRRIVREGEMLDEYRVFKIDRNKVVLKKEGEEIVLNLFQSPVVITEHEHRSINKRKF
jgi:hypothetical protein